VIILQNGFKAIAVLALVLALTVAAVAAETTDKIGLGVRGGLFLSGGEWKLGPMGGAEVKFGVHKNWSIGLCGMYGPTKDGMLDLSGDLPALVEADDEDCELRIRHHIIELAGYYNITPDEEETNFYLTAGMGIDSWRVRDKSGNKVFIPDTKDNMFEFRDQQMTLMFGAGMEYFLIEEFSVGGALRYHLLTSVFSQFKDAKDVGGSDGLDNPPGIFEIGATMTAYLGACKDQDKDEVCDEEDKCPETPKGCIVDEAGCPIDEDGDGVCDGLDQCPNTPRGCKVDINGCQSDSDGDGVCDGVDKCPNTPEVAEVDASGCPLDTDKDGVADYKDNCPGTPTKCKVDNSGCPVDSDNDGVCDGIDQCPGTPEGLEVDDVGCPVAYRIEKQVVLVGVTFAVNSARLTDQAKEELDKVVESLKAIPHIRLEIQGHTDISGSHDHNMKLSQQRAESVVEYFVENGVDRSRLTAKGYGPDKPKFDNKTADGRKKNRRVEMVRLN
jgi:outer membrane protein OmpA-like peptidoglycan-associated protein